MQSISSHVYPQGEMPHWNLIYIGIQEGQNYPGGSDLHA